jgi:membrane fusion protein (multidrug efflux system)
MLRRFLVAIVALAVIGAVVWPKLRRPAADIPPAAKSKSSRPAGEPAALRVTTFTVTPAPFSETVAATGTLRAEEGVELLSETNGRVVSINFAEGAHVRQGDLLVKLNDADLRAMLQRATVRRELAEIHERRFAKLLETGSVRQEDYDNAINDLNVQRAEVAIIAAQIDKTEIRAPFDGTIGLRFVSAGAFVNAASRIATLQNLDRLKLDFSVPEKYASKMQLRAAISFTVPGSDHRFTGEIYAIEPRIDSATRTLLLRAVSPNPDRRLLPGGFANVEVTLAEISNALLVPSIAVVPGVSEKNVFVIVGGKAVRRTVQTGIRGETSVQILTGLNPGDILITSGLQQLRAGLPVVAIEARAAGAKSDHPAQ